MELPVDIFHEILLRCSGDVLYTFHTVVRSNLDVISTRLCTRYGVDSVPKFNDFLQLYNEKYLFVHEHPEWYENKFIYTIPVKDVLKRVTQQRRFDLTDRVLTEQILWTSMRHIKAVCKELHCLGLPFDRYLECVDGNYPNATPSDMIIRSCEKEVIKRGISRKKCEDDFIEEYRCIQYGQWHLMDGTQKHAINVVELILTSCTRLDLLERQGDLIVLKDLPEDLQLAGTEMHVDDIDDAIFFSGKVSDAHHLRRLGLDKIELSDYNWYDIRYKEAFKLIGTKSRHGDKYVCEVETKEDLKYVSIEGMSVSVILRNVEYFMKTIPDVDESFLIDTFQMMLNQHDNCYHPYELRMMVERYPQLLTDSTREQIKNIVSSDGPMERWFESL